MENDYSFQIDEEEPKDWLLFYRMRDVFAHANPANPEQTYDAMMNVLGHRNVVDHDVHPDSPRRNRPAYLDDVPRHVTVENREPPPTKDWDAKPAPLPPKDWSKLGR